MRYGSVCSGIEAATAAWHPLGWKPAFFSEIEKFPRAVLEHQYPDVPLHGDFTTIGGNEYGSIDLLAGGTPCQSFSVAGLRKGLSDERGNLALEFIKLADRAGPKWIVWENVPGVLSSSRGRDFGSFLGALANIGYGYAWRVLDAQYFGVAQRRRRVFLVGYLGDWRPAAEVLFERESLCGNPPPRRKAEKAVAALTANGVGTCGADDNQGQAGHLIPYNIIGGGQLGKNHAYKTEVSGCLQHKGLAATGNEAGTLIVASTGDIAHCLNAGGMGRQDYETETLVAHTLRGEGFDASEDGTGRGTPLVRVACFKGKGGQGSKAGGIGYSENVAPTLGSADSGSNRTPALMHGSAVRRLTPIECERLQGFPDGFTQIPWRGKDVWECPDGPRYKALGNSMAVPCMAWLGRRIKIIEEFI